MPCAEDFIAKKERYRAAVNDLQRQRGLLDDDTLRKLHAQIVGPDHIGYGRTLPPYCDDPACRCQTMR
jgi:hypothetical protein